MWGVLTDTSFNRSCYSGRDTLPDDWFGLVGFMHAPQRGQHLQLFSHTFVWFSSGPRKGGSGWRRGWHVGHSWPHRAAFPVSCIPSLLAVMDIQTLAQNIKTNLEMDYFIFKPVSLPPVMGTEQEQLCFSYLLVLS